MRAAEEQLLAAVMVRAVRDYVLYSRSRSPEQLALAEAARAWIFEGPEDARELTSFSGVCLVMNLDRDRVRDRILHMAPADAHRFALDV